MSEICRRNSDITDKEPVSTACLPMPGARRARDAIAQAGIAKCLVRLGLTTLNANLLSDPARVSM
jgi:hypothetical protein